MPPKNTADCLTAAAATSLCASHLLVQRCVCAFGRLWVYVAATIRSLFSGYVFGGGSDLSPAPPQALSDTMARSTRSLLVPVSGNFPRALGGAGHMQRFL